MSSKDRQPADGLEVDSKLFRAACARFATGITVVTTVDADGNPHGMTVNSFTSVSLNPPLVLVCVNLRNSILGHFLTASAFGINILSADQESVSRRFATSGTDRFQGMNWQLGDALRVPLLQNVLATFECAITHVLELGDHTVLVGEVKAASAIEGDPLLYFDSRYQTLLSDNKR